MPDKSILPPLSRHWLSRHQFEQLAAGGGDVDTVTALLASERSWRLIQIRTLLETANDHPDPTGPLPALDEAWKLLLAAERRAPSEIDHLLLHPQLGTWATYTLQRLRGTFTNDEPLWVDVGYLHAFAATAAIRAGLDFTSRVPVREGFAALPALGGVFAPGAERWSTAEVQCVSGQATLSVGGRTVRVAPAEAAAAEWITPPVIRAEHDGQVLSVTLEHVDPYRNLRRPSPPDLLDTGQLTRWREIIPAAWKVLCQACPEFAAPIARGLSTVVPLPAVERFRAVSATAGDAFGSMLTSEPETAPELAVTFVHEFQHIKLGGLLHLAQLQHREPDSPLRAPWRDDPRPLRGVLQGTYAFTGIVEFWRAFRKISTGSAAALAQFEFARWRTPVQETLAMLRSMPELTEVGRKLIEGLSRTAAAWHGEAVPVEILRAAEAAADHSRARWRLHHLRPDAADPTALAHAWSRGMQGPPAMTDQSTVVADPSARNFDTHAMLSLWRFCDTRGFSRLCEEPAAVGGSVSGATPADLAFVAGDRERARTLYRAALDDDPDDVAAWSGLALTAEVPAARVLRERPELVRATYREAGGSGDPLALAAWLAGQVAEYDPLSPDAGVGSPS